MTKENKRGNAFTNNPIGKSNWRLRKLVVSYCTVWQFFSMPAVELFVSIQPC